MPESTCEESTYENLFRRLAPRLNAFLVHRTNNATAAADLVQEAFVKLWENCATVPPDKAKAFVFKVGNNLFLKRFAHQKVVERHRTLTVVREQTDEHPQFQLEEREFEERLRAAIDRLPEGAREVFLLNRMEDMKYREIAELLGISQKAVEKRMHRALVELRRLYHNI